MTKNFELISQDDVSNFPLPPRDSLEWNVETWRQDHPQSSHKDTNTIYYRMPPHLTEWAIFNELHARWLPNTPAWVMEVVRKIADGQNWGKIGRVMLVRLPSGGEVKPHVDEGKYAQFYDRLHLVLQGKCCFHCGDEFEIMKAGQLWKFNHHLLHRVANVDDEDRITLIVDGAK